MAKFCRNWLRLPFARLLRLRCTPNGPAIRRRRHAVNFAEVADKVTVRTQTHLLQHLLHGKKRGPQHELRLAQAKLLQILRRTRACLQLKEETQARRGEIDKAGERRGDPRTRSLGLEL